ncbi:hypothetical protein SNARM312S_01075 [Streptomyces narbonensis]
MLESTGSGRLLGLETAGGLTPRGAEARPRFFSGFLAAPQAAARGLLAVADVAAARYHQRTRPGSLDPVVTGNGDRLRFESFSGCGGVYARLDVLSEGLDGAETGHGTTNVDVNDPLREALSRMTGDEPLHLRVGPEELAVTTLAGAVVEKKVPLPDRWLRGFAEAQVASTRFDLRAELAGAEAVRFLRSLPRGQGRGRGPLWIAPAGRTLRPTTRPGPGAVCCRAPTGWPPWSGCCGTRRGCECTGRCRTARRRRRARGAGGAARASVDRSWIDSRLAREPEATACLHEGLTGIRDTRLWEAASLVGTDALPFLLAAPTLSTGGIDPATLVERLRAYRDAGVEHAPVDLAQALLRVLRADPGAGRAAEEAWELDTPAGLRLAAWLRSETPLAADVRVLGREEDRSLLRWHVVHRLVVDVADSAVVREEFPPAFRWLGGVLEAAPRSCSHWIVGGEHWASVLPADREVLAACLVPSLARSVGGGARETTEPLTGTAEAEGPVGRGVALALALGLGNGDADDRLRAVDALLVLASRGDLDARRVGEELGWLLAEGSVKPNRLADAARTAAATGAYGTVWAVLAAALPEALGDGKPVRGLGEVLAVAADCVERCGARGELAGLDGVASAKGSTQLVAQAKRLRDALRR